MALAIPIISTFDGGGVKKAINEFKNLEGAGKKAQFAIKKAAVPAAAALGGLAIALGDAVAGAIEDAAAQDLLANSLRKTTGANDAQIASVEDWITKQGQLLGFSDDKLRPVLNRLAKATGSVTKAQELASQAMDISTATGKPLETVVGALEKAYGGNLAALGKLAPEYRDMIKNGASFEEVMAKLAKTTGGAAAEAADTTAGKFARLKIGFDETKESIGAALLPAVEKLLPYLQAFAKWAQDNPQTFMIIAGALAAIAASIVAINIAMALNPIGLITIGVIALIAALAIAYTKFEGFRNVVKTVVNFAIGYFELLANSWIKVINFIIRGYNALPGVKDINLISEVTFGRLGENNGPSGADKSRLDVVPAMATGAIANARNAGGGINITVNSGLVSTPDQIGQDIITAIQKAERRSGQVFATA